MLYQPLDEAGEPLAGVREAGERCRVADRVFHGLEERFDERVIITHPGPGVGEPHVKLRKEGHKTEPSHGAAVIGVDKLRGHPQIAEDAVEGVLASVVNAVLRRALRRSRPGSSRGTPGRWPPGRAAQLLRGWSFRTTRFAAPLRRSCTVPARQRRYDRQELPTTAQAIFTRAPSRTASPTRVTSASFLSGGISPPWPGPAAGTFFI